MNAFILIDCDLENLKRDVLAKMSEKAVIQSRSFQRHSSMNAFIVIDCGLEKLIGGIPALNNENLIISTGFYELSETEIELLRQADTIHIVISETSMCSTAYQHLLYETYPQLDATKCRVLNLDGTAIPLGLSILRTLEASGLTKS